MIGALNTNDIIFLIIKISLGGFAVFLSILIWKKAAKPSILFIVFTVILAYIKLILSTLNKFGFIQNIKLYVYSYAIIDYMPIIFLIITLILILNEQYDN